MPVSKAQLFPFFTIITLVSFSTISDSATFTIKNNCPHTIWPGTLSGSGTPPLPTTGFRLDSGQTIRIPSVPGWSGRIWARTGCDFDGSGAGKCITGDCGGRLECGGNGASPPASLFEITLGMGDNKDFYDVSLVDGYNLPLLAAPVGAFGSCNATGCDYDINTGCPKELQVVGSEGGAVVACKSACEAFGLDQYCCSGQFANPTNCRPSFYSTLFKQACPRAYSYAFDDGTSTFTCKAYEYSIIFCPYNDNGNRISDAPLLPPSITSLPPPSIDPFTPPSIPSFDPLTPPLIDPLAPPSLPLIGSFPPPPIDPFVTPSIGSLSPPLIDPLTPSFVNPLTPPFVNPLTPPSIPIEDPRHKESVRMVSSSVTHLPLLKLTLLLIVTLISYDH